MSHIDHDDDGEDEDDESLLPSASGQTTCELGKAFRNGVQDVWDEWLWLIRASENWFHNGGEVLRWLTEPCRNGVGGKR